ncbi:MAG: TraV family lipoprotein [Holosporales bacterium]
MKLQYLTLLSVISGCTNLYKSDFDCAPEKGLSCKSVSKVNELIDAHKIENHNSAEESLSNPKDSNSLKSTSLEPFGKRGVVKPGLIKRIPEKIIRVWVAGYETSQGDLYEPYFVNLVVDRGHWVNGSTR